MKINNKYVKTYLQIVTKWKKTKQNIPLGVRHVNRCPSPTENNSLTQTFVFVFEAERKREPKSNQISLRGFQKYLFNRPQVKKKWTAAIGRGKVKYQRHSHDVNRLTRRFNEHELPNYVALPSRLQSGAPRLSIIPQSKNNVPWRMMIFACFGVRFITSTHVNVSDFLTI